VTVHDLRIEQIHQHMGRCYFGSTFRTRGGKVMGSNTPQKSRV
jgi:hypothetical protein